MGWLIGGAYDRKTLVDQILADYKGNGRYVDHSQSGNELYILVRSFVNSDALDAGDDASRVILVYKMAGYGADGWGYKDMSEDMGPYYYNCPERLLKQSTCTSETAVEWRGTCRKIREEKSETKKLLNSLVRGDTVMTSAFGLLMFLYDQNGKVCRNTKGEVFRYPAKYFRGATKID